MTTPDHPDPGPTPFVESNLLLAVIAGDEDEAQRIADELMSDSERMQLRRHMGEAIEVLRR